MKWNEAIRMWLPPIVLRWVRWFCPNLRFAPDGWETSLPSTGWDSERVIKEETAKWNQFLKNLENAGPLGFSHESDDLSEVRNVSFHNIHMTFAYALALASRQKSSVSVLDWGGGLGHYQRVAKALLPDVPIEYHVKEMPAMCGEGKRLNPEVVWHTDDECLKRTYDLVVVNGSLQYVREWQEQMRRLAGATGGYLLLTRLPVTENGPSFVAIQKAYDVELLHQQLDQREVLSVAAAAGLQLLREVVVGDRPVIPLAPAPSELKGWLFARNPR